LKNDLTAERVRELLTYNPETGVFTWNQDMIFRGRVNAKSGAEAGNLNKCIGYVQIGIGGALYYAHRLAWLYMYGSWPAHGIDHADGIRSNNRIGNLRCATQSENNQNQCMSTANTSGFTGVSWHKQRGKWNAAIKINNKKKSLGLYCNIIDAANAYKNAKALLHQFQPIGRGSLPGMGG